MGKKDEFLSGIAKDEKFIPIITLVVYCGTEHGWDGARCLYDLLDIDDEIKAYVTNYKLNLYDCHEHDTFDEYRTGLRQLFEVIRYGNDKEQLQRVMEENKKAYSSLDSDTREMLEVMANVKLSEEHNTMADKEGLCNMIKAFEDMRLEGKMEGKMEGKIEGKMEQMIQLVCKKLRKNKTAEVIAEELEEEVEQIRKIIEAQKRAGSYDAEQICKIMIG